MDKRKKPPAREADGFRNVFSLAANTSEDSHPDLVLQFLIRRYGVSPEVGATIAELAGLGPREVRA